MELHQILNEQLLDFLKTVESNKWFSSFWLKKYFTEIGMGEYSLSELKDALEKFLNYGMTDFVKHGKCFTIPSTKEVIVIDYYLIVHFDFLSKIEN